MVGSLKGISVSSSKLLLAVKAMSVDPNAPNAKNQLAAAARLGHSQWSGFVYGDCNSLVISCFVFARK